MLFLATSTVFAQHMDNYNGPMDLPSLVRNLPSQEEAFAELSRNNGNVKVVLATFDPTPLTEAERRARPHWDYGTTYQGCAYIMHAYQHTILGIPYGPIYYVPQLIGCID